MVSFFGLKFGGDKKKADKGKAPDRTPAPAPAAQGPKKWDQNMMGQGQFFGTNVGNGSIRSVTMPSRPSTPSSSRISPYTHNTHALAASSMYDLSNISHIRQGSSNSLKPAFSEANLRTAFNNTSATNPRIPTPGFGSRPGTPGGTRSKTWVNPLDVHFARTTPSAVPAAPRSPLAKFEIGAEKEKQDSSLLFGDKAENVAQAIMASVAQKEQDKMDKEREEKGKVEKEREERERRQKAQEEEREKEGLREQEREKQREQEMQKAAAQATAIRQPVHGPPGPASPTNSGNRPMNGPVDRPIFKGPPDQRPGSRNGNHNGPGAMDRPVFQGQGDHRPGNRNGNRPGHGPGPNQRPHFQGQRDQRPGSRNGQHDQRPRFQGQMDQRPSSRNGPHDRPHFQGQPDHRPGSRNGQHDRPVFQGHMDHRPGSRNGQRRDGPPTGYPNGRPINGSPMRGLGPMNGQARGPMNGPGPMISPKNGPMGSPTSVTRAPGPANGPNRSGPRDDPRDTPHPEQDPYFPADIPSPTGSVHSPSDEQPAPQAAKPVIRNVAARRDTLASITPKRNSLEMTIEAFEKSLVDAKLAEQDSKRDSDSDSDASSTYSVDEIIESPIQPPPQPRPTPPYATALTQRSHSPGPRRPIPGKNVPRPNPEEYGVTPTGRATPVRQGTGTTISSTTSGSTRLTSSSPPTSVQRPEHASLEPAPLFRQPKWSSKEDEDFRHDDFSAAPRPAPAPSPKPTTTLPPPIVAAAAGPPLTPESANWPLAVSSPTSSPAAVAPPPQLKRPNQPPPPLTFFDFSPDAPSRDRNGPFTPPPQPMRMLSGPGLEDAAQRPSTAEGGTIGMARGPSVRYRRPDFGLESPTGIADRFGTPLI